MSSTPQSTGRQYDVCLSFAGEQRPYVERVAQALRERGKSVFYDKYEAANLWGRNLVEHLDWVYRESAHYCVLFASAEYAAKNWTTHERRSAQARALEEREVYLLPARFDDTEIPGLLPTVAYIDLRNMSPEQFADVIIEKLQQDTEAQGSHSRSIPKEPRSMRPFWDPNQEKCQGVQGSPVVPGQWQVSVPSTTNSGRSIRPGQVIPLGLRKKDGQQKEMYWYSTTVFAPDGTSTQAEQFLYGNEWAEVNYPIDFGGAPSLYPPGAYTILWELAEGFLACSGFLAEDRINFGAEIKPADPRLQDFEVAWQRFRDLIEHAKLNPAAARTKLIDAVDQVVVTRNYSRETLAQTYGGYWVGDQVLHQTELGVGAPTRELNHLAESWILGGGGLPAQAILDQVLPLTTTTNSIENQEP
jgi:hypothetical protein